MTRVEGAERRHHGDVLVRADVAGTVVFVATAVLAATTFTTTTQWIGAITALVLFAIGVFAFLWSYWNAVQRSRTDEISVTQLYLLLGTAIPGRVRRTMNLALTVQFVTALATTLARPDGPDGNPGSSLAVGFLVPMFGFGLNGLWAAFHGTFERRDAPEPEFEAEADTPSRAGDDDLEAIAADDAIERGHSSTDEHDERVARRAGTTTRPSTGRRREMGQNADHG